MVICHVSELYCNGILNKVRREWSACDKHFWIDIKGQGNKRNKRVIKSLNEADIVTLPLHQYVSSCKNSIHLKLLSYSIKHSLPTFCWITPSHSRSFYSVNLIMKHIKNGRFCRYITSYSHYKCQLYNGTI